METDVNEKVPFTREWNVLNKVSNNLYTVYRKIKEKTIYSLLYVHSFSFIIGNDYKECEKYNLTITNPNELENMNDKIRYLRLRKSMYQKDVAEYIGIDRATYSTYENGIGVYPKDVMMKLSEMYKIDLDVLLDDYHRFIYYNQGQNIRRIRQDLGLNQEELAESLGVSLIVVKKAEQEKVRFLKKNYIKLMDFYNKQIKITI